MKIIADFTINYNAFIEQYNKFVTSEKSIDKKLRFRSIGAKLGDGTLTLYEIDDRGFMLHNITLNYDGCCIQSKPIYFSLPYPTIKFAPSKIPSDLMSVTVKAEDDDSYHNTVVFIRHNEESETTYETTKRTYEVCSAETLDKICNDMVEKCMRNNTASVYVNPDLLIDVIKSLKYNKRPVKITIDTKIETSPIILDTVTKEEELLTNLSAILMPIKHIEK